MKPLLYLFAGLGVWTLISLLTAPLVGRMMRRLDDPELVAQLHQLHRQNPPAPPWVDEVIRRCNDEVTL